MHDATRDYRPPEAEVVVFGPEYVACEEYSWQIGDEHGDIVKGGDDGDDDWDIV